MGVKAGLLFLTGVAIMGGALFIWRSDLVVTGLGMVLPSGWNATRTRRCPPITPSADTQTTAPMIATNETTKRPRGGERVAVVFYGIRLHAFDAIAKKGRKSAFEMAVEELDADVFVYGSSAFGAAEALRPMQHRIKGLYLGRQMTRNQMAATRDAGVDYAKWRKWVGYFEQGGGNAFEPNVLFVYYWLEKAYETLVAYEELHNFKYDWIHFMRPDIEWRYQHPPLHMFDRSRLYGPDVASFGGFEAHTLLCHRPLCHIWGTVWTALLNGTAMKRFTDKGLTCLGARCNQEYFAMRYFQACDVPLAVYPRVLSVICVPNDCNDQDYCDAKNCPLRNNGRGWIKYGTDEELDASIAKIRMHGWRPEFFLNVSYPS